MLHQTANDRGFDGTARHQIGFRAGPLRRQFLGAQFLAGPWDQLAHPDLFRAPMLDVIIRRVPFPAGGASEMGPAADFVGGPLVELRIDKRLDHGHRVFPTLQPVGGEACEHQFHEAADQIRRMAVGQDQQARVVGDETAAAATLLGRPADELIPRFEMQRGRAPGGHGQPLALVEQSIAQLLAHQSRVVQVMMLHDQLVAPEDIF